MIGVSPLVICNLGTMRVENPLPPIQLYRNNTFTDLRGLFSISWYSCFLNLKTSCWTVDGTVDLHIGFLPKGEEQNIGFLTDRLFDCQLFDISAFCISAFCTSAFCSKGKISAKYRLFDRSAF
jgi:hypothetical protein